tara:strand:- start:43 stop:672 length:630 start_codon:yes stop_codon:yes gene_type:complete
MPRCNHCKTKFEAYEFNGKYCQALDCKVAKGLFLLSKIKDKKSKQRIKDIQGINESKKQAKTVNDKEQLQKEVNKLARKIDERFYTTCIDCERTIIDTVSHGAHRFNVGGHENIRFNLHNVHASTSYCNMYNTEHKVGYDKKLVERYNQEYYDLVHGLDLKYKSINLLSTEITKALKIARKLNRDFNKTILTDSISARTLFNKLIGIYK